MAEFPRYKVTIETHVAAVSAVQARALAEIAADAAAEALSPHYTPAPDDGALYAVDVDGIDLDAHHDLQALRKQHDAEDLIRGREGAPS